MKKLTRKYLRKLRFYSLLGLQELKLLWGKILQEKAEQPCSLDDIPNVPPVKRYITYGLITIVIFVGSFLLWAALAPLETAVVASGKIIVLSSRKSIQHLEGGIVKTIYVQEGSQVKKNQLLIKLDETQSKIRLDLLKNQYYSLKAEETRLSAEREQYPEIVFPENILAAAKTEPEAQKAIELQRQIFKTNLIAFQQNQDILKERIEQLKNEILSQKSQAKSFDTQLALINEEMEAVIKLEAQKYIDKPKLLALKREAARLTGNRDEQLALAARAEQRIGETQIQLLSLKSERDKEIVKNLEDVQSKLVEIEERFKSAQDILNRTDIVAPLDGKVVKLQVHTPGGVVSPGQVLMDIVPDIDELIAEVRINPNNIDSIEIGQLAHIRLVAYNQRVTPQVNGVVIQVSADSLLDEKTGEPFYSVRIKIPDNELKTLKNIKLYPGMPIQAMIVIARKTPLEYLIRPITESFTKAFREE